MQKIILIAHGKSDWQSFNLLLTGILPDSLILAKEFAPDVLQIIEAEQPMLLLLDIDFVENQAFALCDQLKKLENFKALPVILISSEKKSIESYFTVCETNIFSFLVKPVEKFELSLAIKTALNARETEKQLLLKAIELANLTDSIFLKCRENESLLLTAGRIAKFGGWRVDLNTNIVSWSDQVAAIHEVLPGFSPKVEKGIDFYAPEWRNKITSIFTNCAQKGIPYDEEMEIITFNGHRKWVRTTGNAVYDNAGEIVAVEGAFQDISESKKSQERIRIIEKHSHFQEELLNQSPVIAAFHDLDHRLVWANKAYSEATGYSLEALIGKQCFSAWGRNKICKNCPVIKTIATGKICEADLTPNNQDNWPEENGYWLVRSAPIRDSAGQLIGAVEISINIMEREKINQQLIQIQKLESIGSLAGGIAHDFNNMLGVIIGYVELSLGKLADDDPVKDYLKEIFSAAVRSTNITRQLLAFARKQAIAPQILDLNSTIDGTLKMLRRLIGENITLKWIPEKNPCVVKIDPSQIDQILTNLCVNARDAIGGVGEITIKTSLETITKAFCNDHPGFIPGQYICLSISDNGCGIEKENIDKIFEPFFTTKETGKGTGLGLSTVYGIIKQNDGFIKVNSEPGHGTTISVFLAPYSKPSELDEMMKTENFPKGNGETILIVEDEITLLLLIQSMLKKLGYKVLTASSTLEALKIVKEQSQPIDLLLTDVIMPEMSGRDLSRTIEMTFPEIKIIYMSGYTSNILGWHGVIPEGINFLPKPIFLNELAQRIQKVLSAKKEI